MKKVMGIIMSLMLIFSCMNVVLADDSETTSCVVKYAVGEYDVITANQEIKLDGITMTYGTGFSEGVGRRFSQEYTARTTSSDRVSSVTNDDGTITLVSGAYIKFAPKCSGKIFLPWHTGRLRIIEDGVEIESTTPDNYSIYEFDVKANSVYYVYTDGMFMLYGFEFEFAKKVPYTINYIYNGKTLYSDESEDFIFSTIKAEKTLLFNSVKYVPLDESETSMKLVDGTNVLNVYLGKATDYTVNYVYNGNTISTESGTKAVGSTVTAQTPITVSGTKYYAKSDTETSMTLIDGTNVLNVELEIVTYTVDIKAVGDIEKDLSTITVVSEEDGAYVYPKYIFDGTTLYSAQMQADGYCGTVENVTENGTVEITYTKCLNNNIVYFSEGEDIDGATRYSYKGASNGYWGYLLNKSITTLEKGVYKIYAGFARSDQSCKFVFGDDTVTVSSTGSKAEVESDEIYVSEETTLIVSGRCDYVIIQKTGDADFILDGSVAVQMTNAQTKYVSNSDKATGFTAKFINDGTSLQLIQNLTWTITPQNEDGVDVPCELGTIKTLKSGASATVGIVLDGLYDDNASATVDIG